MLTCTPSLARAAPLVLLVAAAAGCGHASHPAIGGKPPGSTRVKVPATLHAACQEHTAIPRMLRVTHTGTPPSAVPVSKEVGDSPVVRKLSADICQLPKASQRATGHTSLAYHLRFYSSAGLQTLAVTAYATGARRLTYSGSYRTMPYQTNNRFWSLLAKAFGVPERKLFPPVASP